MVISRVKAEVNSGSYLSDHSYFTYHYCSSVHLLLSSSVHLSLNSRAVLGFVFNIYIYMI